MGAQQGQALVDYVLCIAFSAVALCVPVVDGRPVASALAHALAESWRAFSTLIALA